MHSKSMLRSLKIVHMLLKGKNQSVQKWMQIPLMYSVNDKTLKKNFW